MYLNNAEKETLCRNIHKVLTERGGYWITADIYIKQQTGAAPVVRDNRQKKFFQQHNIEDNKFESFVAAETFFNSMGFTLDKEAEIDHSQLSSMKYLLANMPQQEAPSSRQRYKIQATWRLSVTDKESV